MIMMGSENGSAAATHWQLFRARPMAGPLCRDHAAAIKMAWACRAALCSAAGTAKLLSLASTAVGPLLAMRYACCSRGDARILQVEVYSIQTKYIASASHQLLSFGIPCCRSLPLGQLHPTVPHQVGLCSCYSIMLSHPIVPIPT